MSSVPPRGLSRLVVLVDVTDSLRTGWRAGIQRVMCQLLAHLESTDRLDVRPMTWSAELAGFRYLTADERRSLRDDDRPSVAVGATPPVVEAQVPPLRRLPSAAWRFVRRAVNATLRHTHTLGFVHEVRRRAELATVHRWLQPYTVREFPVGSVLLEIDATWNVEEAPREQLYADAAARGVHVVPMVYDLIPLEHPDWFEAAMVDVFAAAVGAQARHAELVLAISEHSGASFTSWSRAHGFEPPTPVVVTLGSDVTTPSSTTSGRGQVVPLPSGVVAGRYVLVVGTLEPRKNHAVLLDAFERLSVADPELSLVVVGRAGWNTAALVERVEEHPLLDSRLFWVRGVSDELLDQLYEHTLVVAVPSISEGFGLPVVEALRHGVPVVSSDGGALPEAGGDLVDYVGPADVDGWIEQLGRHAADPQYRRAQRERIAGYAAPVWTTTAGQVAGLLLERFAPPSSDGASGAPGSGVSGPSGAPC